MRRREAGRGAAPAGLLARRHSGGIGAPSGATRSPCQELADGSVGAIRCVTDRTKAGPDAATAVIGAPEGARVPQGTSHKDFALFGAPSPLILSRAEDPVSKDRGKFHLKTGRPKRRGKEPACPILR